MTNKPTEELNKSISEKIERINISLEEFLPNAPMEIMVIEEALSYSLFAGGKRIRPLLALMCGELCGAKPEDILPAACSVEFIHTYSLIHDDLPAIDNDDMRRGKPTSHKVYGEAIAVLTGDAFLTHAFGLLTRYEGEITRKLLTLLIEGAGMNGMLGGQVADIIAEKEEPTKDKLNFIHERKTGALIKAAVLMGGAVAKANDEIMQHLDTFSEKTGLAFQVIDDILDEIGDEKKMGKKVRKDKDKNKCTYPAVYGIEKSREIADELTEQACKELETIHDLTLKASPGKKVYIDKAYDDLKVMTGFLLQRVH